MAASPVKGICKRGGVYYLDTQFHGVRIRERIGGDYQAAVNALRKRQGEVLDGKYAPGKQKKERSLTIAQVLEFYWETKVRFQARSKDISYLLTKVADCMGTIPADKVCVADVLAFARKRFAEVTPRGTHPKYRTVEAELDRLNLALNWAVMNEKVRANNLPPNFKRQVKSLFPQEEHEIILLDNGEEYGPEWLKLYNAAGATLKPKIETLYETGMRKNELRVLRWTWVDLTGGFIRLPGMYQGQPVTKSRKGREIPISDRLRALLVTLPKDSEYVFSDGDGEQSGDFRKAFELAVKRAGLRDGISPHALRRTRATIWNRIDERAAMKALGHSDLKTHRHNYAEVPAGRVAGLVENPQYTHKSTPGRLEAATVAG